MSGNRNTPTDAPTRNRRGRKTATLTAAALIAAFAIQQALAAEYFVATAAGVVTFALVYLYEFWNYEEIPVTVDQLEGLSVVVGEYVEREVDRRTGDPTNEDTGQ